jgi:hypothetical protein
MRAKKERELNDSEGPEVPNPHGARRPRCNGHRSITVTLPASSP